MSKTVSNDTLWEKLSEIDRKLNQQLKEQKVSVQEQEQVDITSELKTNKDEIAELFKKGLQGLGTHCDAHFKTMYKNIEQLGEDTEGIYKVLTCISAILKEPKQQAKTKLELDKSFLNFIFFKLRKTTLIITILGLLVFILTIFSMKQQNDYALLNDKHYKQSVTVREMQVEVDSLRNTVNVDVRRKKK